MTPTPEIIIQNVPVRIVTELTVTVKTPPGADTQKIFDSLLPEIISRLRGIPWVAKVDRVGVEEIVPDMKSRMNH